MEEVVASELLFQKAISEADKQSREKLAKMFGMTIIPRVNSNAPLLKSLQSVQPVQKKLQGTLDRYMLDSMLIDASKAASAKALKAAKTADAKTADAKAADAKAADAKAADAKAADAKTADSKAAAATPKKSSRAKKTADVNV
jgi:hypothetical protein